MVTNAIKAGVTGGSITNAIHKIYAQDHVRCQRTVYSFAFVDKAHESPDDSLTQTQEYKMAPPCSNRLYEMDL